MDTEQELKTQTRKWLARIESEIRGTRPLDKRGEPLLKNIRAYIKDSGYFIKKGDWVRAFEAVIWAWSWLSIARELKLLKTANKE